MCLPVPGAAAQAGAPIAPPSSQPSANAAPLHLPEIQENQADSEILSGSDVSTFGSGAVRVHSADVHMPVNGFL